MLRRTLTLIATLLAAAGCDCGGTLPSSPDASTDASADASPAPGDDAGPLCTRDRECDDRRFCNGLERCIPGSDGADARGCVLGTDPCSAGQTCSEATATCELCAAETRDRDGDGYASIECGGDDCDDDESAIHPGRSETCDSLSVDEDCDPSTLGGIDVDGDRFESAACCNGATCGPDCHDLRRDVHPGATEQCNAVDDDCDGAVDEAGAFCPIGVCIESRCRALNWERVYDGPDSFDAVFAVAADAEANSYFLVRVRDGADLNDDTIPEPGGTYVVSLQPDGRVRWFASAATSARSLVIAPDASVVVPSDARLLRLSGADGTDLPTIDVTALAASPEFCVVRTASDRVVIGCTVGPTIQLIAFDADWREAASLVTPSGVAAQLQDLALSEAGIALTGESDGPFLIDGIEVGPGRFVLTLRDDLTARWTARLPSGIPANPTGVAISRTGQVAVGGSNNAAFSPEWEEADWPLPAGTGDAYAIVFDVDAGHLFTHRHRGPAADNFAALDFDDRGALLLAGYFSGDLPVMPRGVLTAAAGTFSGFYALMDATSTFTIVARSFTGSSTFVQGVHIDPFGGMLVAGRFQGTTTLVLDTSYTSSGAGFAARVADFAP